MQGQPSRRAGEPAVRFANKQGGAIAPQPQDYPPRPKTLKYSAKNQVHSRETTPLNKAGRFRTEHPKNHNVDHSRNQGVHRSLTGKVPQLHQCGRCVVLGDHLGRGAPRHALLFRRGQQGSLQQNIENAISGEELEHKTVDKRALDEFAQEKTLREAYHCGHKVDSRGHSRGNGRRIKLDCRVDATAS